MVEDKPDKAKVQKRKPTIGDLSRFLSALEYSPEEISTMSLSEVIEEIGILGEDYNALKETVEHKVKIIRGRVDSMSLYEITDNELNILENGPPSSTYLNFAIFLLSVAISFLISLATTKIESDRTFTIFVVITVVGLIAGLILLSIWYRTHRSVSEIIRRIKSRIASDN